MCAYNQACVKRSVCTHIFALNKNNATENESQALSLHAHMCVENE